LTGRILAAAVIIIGSVVVINSARAPRAPKEVRAGVEEAA
jgi:hypothetical protein